MPLSPSAPSLSSHADSWRSSSALSSLLPPPTLTDTILDDLAVPQFSLAIVAQKHGLTLSGMLTWLNLPETREVLALRESAAYAHARHIAALNIGHAVETVASIVRDYNTTRPEREAQDRKIPGSAHRAATNARKAAWLLLQFARIVPVNESDLRRARDTSRTAFHRVASLLEEQACSESESAERTSSSHRTANVSERISPDADSRATGYAAGGSASANDRATGCLPTSAKSSVPVPSKSASDFDALSVLVPASSLQDEANSADANSQEPASSESATPSHGCASAAMPPDHDRSPPSPRSPLSLSPSVPLPLSTPAPSTSSTRAPPAPAFV